MLISFSINNSAGEITLQADNIKIKADNEVSIEAGSKIKEESAQIELSGSQIKSQGAMTEISGGQVTVQGAALVDIKGALVKINS
jgi:hypothetical protein